VFPPLRATVPPATADGETVPTEGVPVRPVDDTTIVTRDNVAVVAVAKLKV
jgi:hypothetical protein